jgi:hypothetical protein
MSVPRHYARAHGVTEQAGSLWERHGKVPKTSDTLIRIACLVRADRGARVAALVDRMSEVETTTPQRIVARLGRPGWKLVVERVERSAEDDAAHVRTAVRAPRERAARARTA